MGRGKRKRDAAELAEKASEMREHARELAGEGGEAVREFAQSTGKAAKDFASTALEAAKELLSVIEEAGDTLSSKTNGRKKRKRRGRKLLGLIAVGTGVVLVVNENARNALKSALGRGRSEAPEPWSTSEFQANGPRVEPTQSTPST
jgi:hypothetical protein